MNGRRLLLRTAVVAGVVGAALIAPRLTIHALPAPPGRIVARPLLSGSGLRHVGDAPHRGGSDHRRLVVGG